MADPHRKTAAADLRPQREGPVRLNATEMVAVLLSLIWVTAVVAYVVTTPRGDGEGVLGLVMTLLVVFLPLALIWVAVTTLRTVHHLRVEAAKLQAAVDAMRNAYVASQAAAATTETLKPSVEKKLDEIAAAQRQTEFCAGNIHLAPRWHVDGALSRPQGRFGCAAPGQPRG